MSKNTCSALLVICCLIFSIESIDVDSEESKCICFPVSLSSQLSVPSKCDLSSYVGMKTANVYNGSCHQNLNEICNKYSDGFIKYNNSFKASVIKCNEDYKVKWTSKPSVAAYRIVVYDKKTTDILFIYLVNQLMLKPNYEDQMEFTFKTQLQANFGIVEITPISCSGVYKPIIAELKINQSTTVSSCYTLDVVIWSFTLAGVCFLSMILLLIYFKRKLNEKKLICCENETEHLTCCCLKTSMKFAFMSKISKPASCEDQIKRKEVEKHQIVDVSQSFSLRDRYPHLKNITQNFETVTDVAENVQSPVYNDTIVDEVVIGDENYEDTSCCQHVKKADGSSINIINVYDSVPQ